MIDFHSHLMPGVDDGAADLDESRAGLQVMVEQGVTTIITTPHVRGSQTHRPEELYRYLLQLDSAFESLKNLAGAEFPGLRVERGAELMLDVPSPVLIDERLHLAGTKFMLVEFPFMNIPPHSTIPIREIKGNGVIPIIAHPERYSNMSGNMEIIESWRDAGACIQINAGSVVGQYGATAKRLVWQILENGWADYLSSDYHSRGRCPIRDCEEIMRERGGAAQHHALTVTNPERCSGQRCPSRDAARGSAAQVLAEGVSLAL
jgi:Capsular polysaccharide biosynthesis protein